MTHIDKDGNFQSDKYPWCKPGFLPLKFTDPMAQDLLWEYSRRRSQIDLDFSFGVAANLEKVGFKPLDQKELDEAMELARKTLDRDGIWSRSTRKLGRALLHLLSRTGKPMKVPIGPNGQEVEGLVKDGIVYVPLNGQDRSDAAQEHTGR